MSAPIVLFLCQHNAGRSQLAAALLELDAGDRIDVRSAGTKPADQIGPAVVASMRELGVDVSDRVPRSVTVEDLAEADIVVAMRSGLELPAHVQGRFIEWEFPDPGDWDVESVRPLREAISAKLPEIYLALRMDDGSSQVSSHR